MIRKWALAGVAAFAIAQPAFAEEIPRPGRLDPRIRTVDYDPEQVYQITGVFRTATQIVLSPREEILHVALGDTVAWEVAAEKHILFIKPREPHRATNLIVTTTRDGQVRNYQFELTARDGAIGANSANTFFQVTFRYPDDERLAELQAIASQAAELQTQIVDLQLAQGAVEGIRNYNYSIQGSSALQPSEVSDNNRYTIMRFPGSQPMPSIFTVTPDGSESLVPYDVRGEFIVIHATAPEFRLRRGVEVLCIYNEAFQPYGENIGTGTASPVVERQTAPEGQQ